MLTKRQLDKIVKYVNDLMNQGLKPDNVSIWLAHLEDKDLKYLRTKFKRVEPQGFLGYVMFERQGEL